MLRAHRRLRVAFGARIILEASDDAAHGSELVAAVIVFARAEASVEHARLLLLTFLVLAV